MSSSTASDSAKSPKPSANSSPRSSSPSATPKNNTAPPSPKAANGDDALARAEAQKAAGTARYSAGAFDEAIPLYTSALALLPPTAPASTRASLLSNRSACYVMLKQFQPALQDSLAAIDADPTFSKAYGRASKCYLAMGEFGQARVMLSRSPVKAAAAEVEEVTKYERMQMKAAELLPTNPALALQFLHSLLLHTPANNKALALQIQALINTKQVDKAKLTVDALYREDPKNVEFLYLRGLCFYSQGNLDMALKHMQQVLSSDPDHSPAMRLFKQIRAMEVKKAEGNALFSQEGKAQEAVDKYTEALAIDPTNAAFAATLLANRAAAHMKLKQWDAAIADCDQSLATKADNVKVLLRRSTCRKEKGDLEEAVRDIEAALRVEKDNDDLKRQLREAKLQLKKSKRKDYYQILGMDKSNFSESELKKAYRRAALQWHPDKNNATEESRKKAEAMFKDITEAYETLNDDQKRRRYDSGADLEDEGMGGGGGPDIDPADLFGMFFGGGGGGGMGGMGGMPFGRRGGGHGHAHGPGGFRH